MSKLCEFVLPVAPTPKLRQRARVLHGRATTYTAPRQRTNVDTLIALLSGYAPKAPAIGPLMLEIVCGMQYKSMPKRAREGIACRKTLPAKKPDLDNLVKQLMDAMSTLRFWEDDSQVCILVAGKQYAEHAYWWARLSTVEPACDADARAASS